MDRRLGKGLGALISDDLSKSKEKVARVRLKDIVPNPFQPRKQFCNEKMEELVNSIKEKGVIQPVLVRPVGAGYELIAGERRFRAAQELQFEDMPVIVMKNITDGNSLEISLIENIQREELNPVEEAHAYQQLIGKFSYTLDKVGQMMGKDKSTISNSLRLLNLPQQINDYLQEGKLSAGHAKALLSVPNDQKKLRLAETIIRDGLSVRQAEELVKSATASKVQKKKTKQLTDPEVLRVEEDLQHYLGTKVNVKQGKKRGRIEIQYYSDQDLQRLLTIIVKD